MADVFSSGSTPAASTGRLAPGETGDATWSPIQPPVARRMLLAAVVLFTTGASHAFAAGNRNAKIMLQALSPAMKNACVRPATVPATCSGYVVNDLDLYPTKHFVYALVTNGSPSEGVPGAAFGIDYDPALRSGVDVFSWTLCASLEFPSAGWPAAGGGNLITFDATTRCQTSGNANVGVVAILG